MFDILKGLHAVDMMVNTWITLGTSRTAKPNTRAAQEAETRSPVICQWHWGPPWHWALSSLWIVAVGQAMPQSCHDLKDFTKYWQVLSAKRRCCLQFPRGKKPLWEMIGLCSAFTLKHFAVSAECIWWKTHQNTSVIFKNKPIFLILFLHVKKIPANEKNPSKVAYICSLLQQKPVGISNMGLCLGWPQLRKHEEEDEPSLINALPLIQEAAESGLSQKLFRWVPASLGRFRKHWGML